MKFLQAGGAVQAKLGEKHGKMRRIFFLQEKGLLIQHPGGLLQEPVIILTEQDHIQIVIPGDKIPVTDCPQKGPGKEEIGNIQCLAHPVELCQQGKHSLLMLLQSRQLSCLMQVSHIRHLL